MRKLILVLLAVVVIGLFCWVLLAPKPQPLSRVLTLPDGTSVRILAVTYGTNHVIGSKLASFTAGLPAFVQNCLRSLGQRAVPRQTITTPTPELLVWLDHRTNSLGATMPGGAGTTTYLGGSLGDGSNFISGQETSLNSFLPWSQIESLHFAVFPRRDSKLTLNIFDHKTTGGTSPCGSLSFNNPFHGTYPQWQAETLPATKRVGDMEVTLQRFETGHNGNAVTKYRKDGSVGTDFGTDVADGRNHAVVELKIHPLTNTNELWEVAGADFSDAAGNSAHNSGMNATAYPNNPVCAISPCLWPGEAAWKIKLELKRSQGFRPEELVTVKNVPLGEMGLTNVVGWTTNINGVTVTLQSICRRVPVSGYSYSSTQCSVVHFTFANLAAGTQVDLLRMVCDTGTTNHAMSWSSSGSERDYTYLDIPQTAKTADFTVALQQSRTVEFTVKPELPQPEVEAKKSPAEKGI